MYTKEWLRAALIRALHTFWQALAATVPAGVVITKEMIVSADWKGLALTVLGWLATALLAGLVSFLKSAAIGVPEVQIQEAKEKPPDTGQEEPDDGRVTVYAYEDYYNGNPVGEPRYPDHGPEAME